MREISITVEASGAVLIMNKKRLLGYSGEHNAAKLFIEFNELGSSLLGSAEYYRIAFNDYYSDALRLKDNQLVYSVPMEAMQPPSVHCQIIGYKTENNEPVMIAKSEVFGLEVRYSKVPEKKLTGSTDVFERTLAGCEAALNGAIAAEEKAEEFAASASASCASALKSAEESSGSAETAAAKAYESSKNAETAASAARDAEETLEKLGTLAELSNTAANAVKKTVNGSVVAVCDVSPIAHELIIQSDCETVTENRTVCETRLELSESTVFEGVDNLTVDFFSPQSIENASYLVPLINGQRADRAKILVYAGEYMDGVGSIVYVIEGTRLVWNGWSMSRGLPSTRKELKGSITVEEGALLTGFVNDAVRTAECPVDITAVTEVKVSEGADVTVTGGNLLPFFGDMVRGTVAGVELSTVSGELMLNGTATSAVSPLNELFSKAFGIVLPSGKYCFSDYSNDTLEASAVIMNGGKEVGRIGIGSGKSVTVNIDGEGECYLGLEWEYSEQAPISFDNVPLKIMLSVKAFGKYDHCREYQTAYTDEKGTVTGCMTDGTMLTAFASSGSIDVTYNRDTGVISEKTELFPNIFSNALKGNIEGTAVAIHDVSPIEHTLSVRLSGNEDLESVKLLQYGKNIYKPKSMVPYGTVSLIEVATVNEDGGIVLKGTAADSSVSYHLDLPNLPVGTYAFNGTNPNVKYYVFTLTSSGEQKTWINNFFTLDDGDRLQYLQLRISRGVTIDDTFYVQIELAKKSTEYTPYIEPKEYKADADGTVKGVTSLYPDMTLLTDTSGVTVRCEYNRDINKAFAAIEKAVSAFSGESNA